MNMHPFDWAILLGSLFLLSFICWWSSRLTKSVADFLAANRLAGRYLLAVGQGMAGLGAITIAANFEKFYQAGFAATWWNQMLVPIGLIISLSGFIIYRYRETRAMTMAQFFEMRYSKRFRIFAGLLTWFSGILNYGIFPSVSARFLIYFTGLPETFQFVGISISTFAFVMAIMLTIAVCMAVFGGQISIMVTDMIQGQFVVIVMLLVLAILFYHMSWGEVVTGLHQTPEGQSKINPFDQSNLPDFNVWFFLMMGALNIYGTRAWQGSQGYNAAARSPHEARMAGILGDFRGMISGLAIMMVPIYVFAYMHLPQFSNEAALVADNLAKIDNVQIQKQMLVPMALGDILPVGVMGLFAAVVILSAVSTDNTYLHSWGSIFIQDVVNPFLKKPLSPRAHMLALRLSIMSVALFAFIWGLVFPLHDYIYMYFQITGAIYLGGAGAVIIGGLYWKRGTAGGAWAAMICGSILAVLGIVVRNIIWPYWLPGWKEQYVDFELLHQFPDKFPLNGMQMSFIAACVAVVAYTVCSLLSKREPANMDRLLHRGKYAIDADTVNGATPAPVEAPHIRRTILQRLGIGPEFTKGDKFIYFFKLTWALSFVFIFIIGTTVNFFWPIPDPIWEKWWAVKTALVFTVGLIFVFWFLWGGFRDLYRMAADLRTLDRDYSDDGTVAAKDHVQQQVD
ncbi:hypothetical protein QEH59_10215 [Coraliomargarita sp. SDUM461004]|uniref:Sodium:solute symporter n=1 Tax=Thalassobacterium sedimentorum TaxID=3041258 RepID=A0ABU1AJ03_9BACT|nr:hypothetical protein [Coraliomargarita sp. SDUM461004]MDQ8194801.1 hypothetical protein [Coraliomargarita sp. SDUM461004]